MRSSVYLDTLRLGFENPTGISFNEVVGKLDINLSDITFKSNYTIWFYTNFYNGIYEYLDPDEKQKVEYYFREQGWNKSKIININESKSFIKGDAINKYIDFVELESARKSSRSAFKFSIASIIIAILSIIAQSCLQTI